jgi:hypothetical protein
MSFRPNLAFKVVFFALAAAPACGDASRFATETDASVITPAVDAVVVQSDGGGYGRLPPTGAACDPGRWTYTLSLRETQVLIWSRCQVSGDGINVTDYAPETGSRTLTTSEWTAARSAAQAVRVSSRTTCGADKDLRFLEVRAGMTNTVYGDDFYACRTGYKYFVESAGLDQLAATVASLAHD